MPRMEVVAAVAIAFAVAYLWMRWDEYLALRKKRIEQENDRAGMDRERR